MLKILSMSLFLALMLLLYPSDENNGLSIVEKVNNPLTDTVAAFEATNPIIVDHGGLGNLDDGSYYKRISFDINAGSYGSVTINGSRKITRTEDGLIVEFFGNGDGVDTFEYDVTIVEGQITYYLNLQTQYATKLEVATKFRIETKKHHDKLMKKLKSNE